MQDISDCVKIPKSTYQRYEDGSAEIPDTVWDDVLALQQSVNSFMAGIPARVDKELAKKVSN